MAKIEQEQISFTGASGNSYGFEAYSLDTEFLDVGAIYIFTKRENRQYIRLYVGQTDNLNTRIPNHEKWPCVRGYGVDSICVRLDGDESSRRRIERDIIDGGTRRPPCNDN